MPSAHAFVDGLAHVVLRLFFRRVEVVGLEHVPEEGGGLLVSWHPNGMIDPLLIFETSPRPVIFGARDGLFRVPGVGAIMRAVGTVPIYRAMDDPKADPEVRRARNRQSLDALARVVAEGSFSCLFPEGDSHDESRLLSLKTGLARLYDRARQLAPEGVSPPVIVPVGLHYDHKHLFRSSVLVRYHPPIELPAELDVTVDEEAPLEELRVRWERIMGQVEGALVGVVHATESWELHHLMHRARALVRAEGAHRDGAKLEPPSMEERTLGFERIWRGYEALRESQPRRVDSIVARIRRYDADLTALAIEDHELDRGPPLVRWWLALLLLVQGLMVYLLLPPLIVFGALANAVPALVLTIAAEIASRREKDEASIKVILGLVVFPLTWIGVGVAAGYGHWVAHAQYPTIPDNFWLAGILVSFLAFAGGAAAWRYLRLARETARAIAVRLTRHRRRVAIEHLREERSQLYDLLVEHA